MKLSKQTIDKLYAHALKEYPFECCGVVAGDDQKVHLCENIQNNLHAEDPERFPRDARTAYFIDRGDFDWIISNAHENGDEIVALYHSHVEHEAYFSEEDVAAQTVFGEPEFPDALHVVVSIMGRKINDIKCFKWDGDTGTFYALEDCV
jgi:adenylyltransferase/sulfurtransferase